MATSSSSSSFNSTTTDRLPTTCYCNPPLRLEKRTSWTESNLARNFLTCPNGMYEWKRCNAFYWIDEDLTDLWYKRKLYEMYMYLNRDQRETFRDGIKFRDNLVQLKQEFEDYRVYVKQKLAASAFDLGNARASASFWKKACGLACLIVVIAFFIQM